MRTLSRAGLAMVAVGVNAALLLSPALVLSGGVLPGATRLWAIACLCVVVAAETACAPRQGSASLAIDDLVWLNWAQGLGLLAAFEVALLGPASMSPAGLLSGSVLILVGGVLRCLAIRRLGGGFTNTSRPTTSELCVDGIYGWLRHPAETGLILIATGFPVAQGAWAIMPWAVAPLLMLSLIRIRLEERGLAHAFPDSLRAHRLRVRF